jgi:hypothetical protein
MRVNNKSVMCDSCGDGLKKGDTYWTRTDGMVMCADCLDVPLYVLKAAYAQKTLPKAKAVIKAFDEECDDSFLEEE